MFYRLDGVTRADDLACTEVCHFIKTDKTL